MNIFGLIDFCENNNLKVVEKADGTLKIRHKQTDEVLIETVTNVDKDIETLKGLL